MNNSNASKTDSGISRSILPCELNSPVMLMEYIKWTAGLDTLPSLTDAKVSEIREHLDSGCVICQAYVRNAKTALDVPPEANLQLPFERSVSHSPESDNILERSLDELGQLAEQKLRTAERNDAVRLLEAAQLFLQARRYDDVLGTLALLMSRTLPIELEQELAWLRDQATFGNRFIEFARARSDATKRNYRNNLRRLLCELQEHFRATSGWLFVHDEDDCLVSSVEQNTSERNLKLRVGQGIVGHVAQTGKGYVARSTADDDHYRELVAHTRSELAAPIKSSDGKVLGVVNLESHRCGMFSTHHVWELESLTTKFVPDILVLNDKDFVSLGADFNARGWGLCDVMESFLFHICDILGKDDITCTIWHMDWEKEELWVRATAGFDAEYIGSNSLPANDSLMGEVVSQPQGYVARGHWRDFSRFLRRDKARWMGLSHVFAVPIYSPGNEAAVGCFNLYTFFKERVVSDVVLRHIADHFGAMWAAHERLQPAVAAAHFANVLANRKRLSSDALFDILKHSLLESLDAESCSIFARHKDESIFECRATTGIEEDGVRVNDINTIQYNCEEVRSGFSTYLATNPDKCIRKNDLPNPSERIGATDSDGEMIRPLKRYLETFSLSESDHRRFLGYGVPDTKSSLALGIVRVLRPPKSRPFVAADEGLIRALMKTTCHVFREWHEEQRLNGYIKDVSRRLLPGGDNLGEKEMLAFQTLIRPVSSDFGSARSLVDDALQNILAFYRRFGGLHASIRAVTRGQDGEEVFRQFAYHSTSSFRAPDEMRFPPVSKEQGSIAWRCLEKWRILTFNRDFCDNLFRPIHDDSTYVSSGACIPLITWTGGKCVKWAFCLDFMRPVEWQSEDIEALLHFARKLTAILSDSAPPLFLPPDSLLRGFVAAGVEATHADWGFVTLRCRPKKNVVARLGRIPRLPAPRQWLKIKGGLADYAAPDFSVRVTEDKTGFRFPLLFGPFEAGHLTCGSQCMDYEFSEGIGLERIARLWASLTGFSGESASYWTGRFESQEDGEFKKGIRVWNAKPTWNVEIGDGDGIVAKRKDAEFVLH